MSKRAAFMAGAVLVSLVVGISAWQGVGRAPGVTGTFGPIAQYLVVNSGSAANISSPAQNTSKVYAFVALNAVTTSTITYAVTTADNTANSYDIGIYDANGNLVCHTGLTAGTSLFPGTGTRSATWTAVATLAAGSRYYFAWSTNAAAPTATFGGTNMPSAANALAGPVPSSGVLVAGTMPADTWAISTFPTFALR